MLKIIVLFLISVVGIQGFSQSFTYSPILFNYEFLYFPHKAVSNEVFQYTEADQYQPYIDPQKRTEDYRYIHNGDYLKGVEDVFAGDPLGADWFKNFDFGKFASVVIEIGGDANGKVNGAFVWSGKLVFFRLVNRRKLVGYHQQVR